MKEQPAKKEVKFITGIVPLDNRILILPDNPESKTTSGIIIPDSAQQKTGKGTVVAIGESEAITLRCGDRVVYGKYAGQEMEFESKTYIILREIELLCREGREDEKE